MNCRASASTVPTGMQAFSRQPDPNDSHASVLAGPGIHGMAPPSIRVGRPVRKSMVTLHFGPNSANMDWIAWMLGRGTGDSVDMAGVSVTRKCGLANTRLSRAESLSFTLNAMEAAGQRKARRTRE